MKKEQDYLELERLSRKLGLPVLSTRIKVEATKDGRVTGCHQDRCHTWNRNFWNRVFVSSTDLPLVGTNFGAGYLSFKQTSGAVGAFNKDQHEISLIGPVNNSSYGLLVGRGSAAEDFEGFILTTPITHGVGANQLSYRLQNDVVQLYTGAYKTWKATLTRLFDNLSGSTITVTETAIVCYTTAYGYNVMLCRDLLAASVDVLNSGVLTVTYEITLVFPA